MFKFSDVNISGMFLGDIKIVRGYAGDELIYSSGAERTLNLCYDYSNAQTTGLQMKPEFKRCVNEQTDFKDPNDPSKTIWSPNQPLPNPNRSDINPKYAVTNMLDMFKDCSMMTSLDLSEFDTSSVTDMKSLFSGCSNLTTLNIKRFNTSNASNMSLMFINCSKLKNVICDKFVISKNTNCANMFTQSYVSSFDWSKVEIHNANLLFCGCLDDIIDLKNADFSKINNKDGLSYSFNSIKASKIYFPTKSYFIDNFFYTFSDINHNFEIDLGGFSNLANSSINFSSIFKNSTGLTNLNGITQILRLFKNSFTFKEAFMNCTNLTSFSPSREVLPRGPMNTSESINLTSMFEGCSKITSIDISFLTNNEDVVYSNNIWGDRWCYGCNELSDFHIDGYAQFTGHTASNLFGDSPRRLIPKTITSTNVIVLNDYYIEESGGNRSYPQ